jgi:GT2 family glycosyltransferase/tetratricopeptide (TPR) repeat protein
MPRLRLSRQPTIITRADRARAAGEWRLAAGLYRVVLDRTPHNPPIWIQYGHALKESGSPAEAETAYRIAIAFEPSDPDSHLQLGHALKLQGKRAEAEAAYRQAWVLDRSSTEAARELAAFGWTTQRLAEADRSTAGLDRPPVSVPVNGAAASSGGRRRKEGLITRADRALSARQWRLAARLYRKALDRNPEKPPIWVQYGHALKESGDVAEAERAYRAALAYAPGVADTHLQLGHALKLQAKTEEAQAAYLRAFVLDPSLPYPPHELGGLGWSGSELAELETLLDGGDHIGPVAAPIAHAANLASLIPSEIRVKVRGAPLDRIEDDIQTLRASGLFDEAYYRATAPDLPTDVDLLRHFVERGSDENLDPHPLFITSYYLACNRDIVDDVVNGRINPTVHFIKYGGFEGRNPHPLFDSLFYLDKYLDVANSGINPLTHYVRYGIREQRLCNPVGHSPFDNYGLLLDETPELAGALESFPKNPTVSVVMPLYAAKPLDKRVLIEAIRSIQGQTYPNWELCICNNGSTELSAIGALDDLRERDPRIRVTVFERNQGISAATNAALDMAGGEFVALMDHDDLLASNALYEVVKHINRHPSVDVLYTDQDKIDVDNNRSDPFYKPDWSPELFRGVMYVGHLLVVRRSLFQQIGRLDSTFDKVQDFELMLRLSEVTERIIHIPKILYHWRMIPGSVALGSNEKTGIDQLQARAVTAHLRRSGIRANALAHNSLPHRVVILPNVLRRRPKVTIVIPSKDAPEYIGTCLDSIFTRSSYDNYEVVVVDNGTTSPEALEILRNWPVRRCPFDGPFNFSRANNLGVAQSSGEFLVFLNNDTQVVTPNWLENMLFYFLEYDDIGMVGPLLTYPDGRVQHAGVVLGFRGTADHVMRFFPSDADGYAGSLCCAREVSGVTAACSMMPRGLFNEIGGFAEEFATIYQDLDLCLRIRQRGLRILYTPQSHLHHHESVSRGDFYDHLDRDIILDVWGEVIARGDPYYNVNLARDHVDYTARKWTVRPWRS